MRVTAKVLQFVAFGVLVAVALVGGLFAAGNAWADMPRGVVVAGIVLWVVVAGGLSWLAFASPGPAVPVLAGVVALMTVLTAVDGRLDLFDRDRNGPVAVVALLSLLVPLAVLGLRRALAAGALLLVPAAGQMVATVLMWTTRAGEAPPLMAMFRGSSGIVILPMVLAGVLLLVVGLMLHEQTRFWHLSSGARVAH